MKKVCHIINNHSPFDNRVFYKEIGTLKDKFANFILFNCKGNTAVKNIGGETILHLDKNFEGEFEGVKFIGYRLNTHFLPQARYQSFVNQICKKMMNYYFLGKHLFEKGEYIPKILGNPNPPVMDRRDIYCQLSCISNIYSFSLR